MASLREWFYFTKRFKNILLFRNYGRKTDWITLGLLSIYAHSAGNSSDIKIKIVPNYKKDISPEITIEKYHQIWEISILGGMPILMTCRGTIHPYQCTLLCMHQEELNKCLVPLRNMLVGINKKISCRVESKFTRC